MVVDQVGIGGPRVQTDNDGYAVPGPPHQFLRPGINRLLLQNGLALGLIWKALKERQPLGICSESFCPTALSVVEETLKRTR
ncbi:hypothetical protein ANCDUO_08389 [Ancylostoma duodenale]|uniref:Uncharacterized protein n=1 Tax=Ancylostoma duodenale TaxID=51022 RepID=A0A0C2DFV0_9BILA|nr:hypothetical protein ANCDUO_08389 [Ancylostoma duodenale]